MESIPQSMESIPHFMEFILKKYGVYPPVHGIHPPFHGFHLKKVWSPSPIPWIPSGISGIHPPFHGFHMDYPGEGKVQLFLLDSNKISKKAFSHMFSFPPTGLQLNLNKCHKLNAMVQTLDSYWIPTGFPLEFHYY